MREIQEQLLNRLLDKYESKKHYGREQPPVKRRTMITMEEKQFPLYFHISDSRFKREFNAHALEMEQSGWIEIKWEDSSRGDCIEKVILQEGKLPELYALLGRDSKILKYKRMGEWIQECSVNPPSMLNGFYATMIERIKRLERLPTLLDLDSERDTRDGLTGLNRLMENQKEMPKRTWSVLLYQDTKRWESLEKRILQAIREWIFPEMADWEDETLLSEWGIIKNPPLVRIAGYLHLSYEGKVLDFSVDPLGIGVHPSLFEGGKITYLEVEAVITIENLTSYYDFLLHMKRRKEQWLVLYLGGFHNPGRRDILRRLWETMQGKRNTVPFYHWGDLDLGGFRIWRHLKEKTGIPFLPFGMNETVYQNHWIEGKKMPSAAYLGKLREMGRDDRYTPFHNVIPIMLERKMIVEQESLAVEELLNRYGAGL